MEDKRIIESIKSEYANWDRLSLDIQNRLIWNRLNAEEYEKNSSFGGRIIPINQQ